MLHVPIQQAYSVAMKSMEWNNPKIEREKAISRYCVCVRVWCSGISMCRFLLKIRCRRIGGGGGGGGGGGNPKREVPLKKKRE